MIFDSKDLRSIILPSKRAAHASAWHGHVSFAHWIVAASVPALIVELGTHNGVSFSAFCNSVQFNKIACRCVAIDTWEGDAHTGRYNDNVYAELKKFTTEQFSGMATLLRHRFDDAVQMFEDGTVDLLHIDGFHTYEAVQNDFFTWKRKLSSRAIVLFHDITVYEHDFGVHKFWSEIKASFPTFSFNHSFGLGVALVGGELSDRSGKLFVDPEPDMTRIVFEEAAAFARESGLRMIESTVAQKIAQIGAIGRNISQGKRAIQSSTHVEQRGDTSAVLDGKPDGSFRFHTKKESNPWIQIDLLEPMIFDEIVVYNRMDNECIHRARNLRVYTSVNSFEWKSYYIHDGTVFGGADGEPLIIKQRDHARFVRMELDDCEYFHLDKVEMYVYEKK